MPDAAPDAGGQAPHERRANEAATRRGQYAPGADARPVERRPARHR